VGNIWSYENKRVLVSGGGGAGMGAAAVRDLIELGAEVHVFDLKEPTSDVASFRSVDLRSPEAIDGAVADLASNVDRIDALFNCAGLPGPPFSGLDTMLVNFVAARHLSSKVSELMPSGSAIATISSAGGMGWENMIETVKPLLETATYEEAKQWCEAHSELVGEGYLLSKQVIIIWTQWAAPDYAKKGIRLNCTSPGPTDTPMMPSFEKYMGKEFMDKFPKPLWGRNSTPEEQAHVIVFLNSDAASYVTGANVYSDGGFYGGMTTGSIDLSTLFG
jgi:NAD(P)-dependent dehydrogenase (short-subunit alcohol dehydrogenase family)